MQTRKLLAALAAATPCLTFAADPAGSAGGEPQAYLKASPALPPLCSTIKAGSGLVRVPLFAVDTAECPVARVDEEFIALRELVGSLASAHADNAAPAGGKRPDKDFTGPLDRLIDVRLIVAEAQEMGLDATEDTKQALDDFRASRLRLMALQRAAGPIQPDALEVERNYKEAIRAWKVRSVVFEKREDATAFGEEVKKTSFDAAAAKAVAGKKGKGGEVETLSGPTVLPAIRAEVSKLKPGGVTDPVAVPKGHAVLKLEQVTYPEDPKLLAEIEAASVKRQADAATKAHRAALMKRWAVVDVAFMKKLDFEAKKPGFAALAKDQRAVARISGERPVTVADVAAELQKRFFHGMDQPIKEKRVNVQKGDALDEALAARLLLKEALELKLDQTDEFKLAQAEHRRGTLFATFVERVLIPDVKVSEQEGLKYFEAHQDDFSYPEMVKLDGLAFGSAKEAQAALDKLKGGTDLKWLRANADRQLPEGQRQVAFDRFVSAHTLEPQLAKALSGAGPGDLRLYAAPGGKEFYALEVVERTPARVRPYPDARADIGKKLYTEKLGKAVREYADKLRKAKPVEVYITRIGT